MKHNEIPQTLCAINASRVRAHPCTEPRYKKTSITCYFMTGASERLVREENMPLPFSVPLSASSFLSSRTRSIGAIACNTPLCVMKGQAAKPSSKPLLLTRAPGRISQPCCGYESPAQFKIVRQSSLCNGTICAPLLVAIPHGKRIVRIERGRRPCLFAHISIPHLSYRDRSSTSTRHHSP